MTKNRTIRTLGSFICILLLSLGCQNGSESTESVSDSKQQAESPEPAEKVETDKPDYYKDEQGQALAGFDAVAYHTQNEAVAGSQEFLTEWSGAKWLFANAENMKTFQESPEKYAPANGGYCTFGIILEKKLDGNPQVWHMKDSQLYMFLNTEVKEKFLLAENQNLAKVAENWPKVKGTTP